MENPYQAPVSTEEVPDLPPDSPESIRRSYLNHEAAVQSIGTICYLGAILWSLVATFVISRLLDFQRQADGWASAAERIGDLFVGLVLPGAIALLLFFGGWGLRTTHGFSWPKRL
jgi:hypothetical protein